ncbi:hypothetical protein KCTC32516_00134 [Polaribacter huanghezhanensis]|uniref:ribosomal maturation YjgA family protein n=1 Tax=Polaribacter huanghezhanensis TaxID=1354726 RepID=UPI0026489EF8|nr:DUF2809 domain-containing protein [Polaribacter huanghezhanensis]WKD84800.1 hypothetical protein KCTC32516_00134 [Polaribacter huanghezhanensis]
MSINKKYIYLTLLVLIIELIIAGYIQDQFIRPFVGDVLAVMLIFSFLRIFYKRNGLNLGFGVLLFAVTIEILQYVEFVKIVGLEDNKIATIILGATFDWLDILAYIIGVFISVLLDKKLTKNKEIASLHSQMNNL